MSSRPTALTRSASDRQENSRNSPRSRGGSRSRALALAASRGSCMVGSTVGPWTRIRESACQPGPHKFEVAIERRPPTVVPDGRQYRPQGLAGQEGPDQISPGTRDWEAGSSPPPTPTPNRFAMTEPAPGSARWSVARVDQPPLLGAAGLEADRVAVAEDPAAIQQDLARLPRRSWSRVMPPRSLPSDVTPEMMGRLWSPRAGHSPISLSAAWSLSARALARGWSSWHNGDSRVLDRGCLAAQGLDNSGAGRRLPLMDDSRPRHPRRVVLGAAFRPDRPRLPRPCGTRHHPRPESSSSGARIAS